LINRTSVAEFPLLGHPKTGTDPCDLTAISTLLPLEPPKESKVCCVILVCRWPESVKVVSSAFPFHMICDWGTNPLPFTISRTGSESPGIGSGKSDVMRGCGTMPRQLLKPTIAPQVDQPDKSRVRNATKATRTPGKACMYKQGKSAYQHPYQPAMAPERMLSHLCARTKSGVRRAALGSVLLVFCFAMIPFRSCFCSCASPEVSAIEFPVSIGFFFHPMPGRFS
jgi:hypothetical protein